MKLSKIIVLSLACFCLPALASSKTDAVILSAAQKTINPPITRIKFDRTAATIENGDVWIWGYRNMGLQGNGEIKVDMRSEPQRVKKFVDLDLNIIQIATGRFHIIALDENGDVWGWGRNKYREATGGVETNDKYVPIPVKVLEGENVVNIYCSDNASFALTNKGKIWVWGRGNRGELGLDTAHLKNDVQKIPGRFLYDNKILSLGIGSRTSFALGMGDSRYFTRVWGWGESLSYEFCQKSNPKCRFFIKPANFTRFFLDIAGSNNAEFGDDSYVSATGIKHPQDIKGVMAGKDFMLYQTVNDEVYGIGELKYLTDESFDEDDLDEDEDDLYIDDEDEERIERLENADDDNNINEDIIEKTDRAKAPIKIIGKAPNAKSGDVATYYCPYKGCYAITKHGNLLTWGKRDSSKLNQILYGEKKAGAVVQRHIKGKLTKIDSGRRHLIYWNEAGEAYGVGSGNYRKFDLSSSRNRDWDSPSRLDFLMDAMHKVYGEDYVLGQVK